MQKMVLSTVGYKNSKCTKIIPTKLKLTETGLPYDYMRVIKEERKYSKNSNGRAQEGKKIRLRRCS